MNPEQARFNMVESQIRTWEVLDQTVLDLLLTVRREEFVPERYRSLAFADMEIPLGHGEVMLAPKMEARMVQELGVRKTDKILEVGTGSGYVTALLAKLGGQVVTLERIREFSQAATRKLAGHGLQNVQFHVGDGSEGWLAQRPYDVILLTGSVPVLSESFQQQLAVGGRLLAVIGDPPVMTANLVTRVSERAFNSVGLFETAIPPLQNVKQPERFVF
ncbi:MAG: protein-L-isoaspartate O-methyltransferase [Betaproteobacteria bacterium]|nr:protein-L-isoaspartate O-methyltransferase [Betaproteobacteria bacterium]